MRETLPVILLLSIFFILVITSVSTKSPICDEAGHHIGTAYSYLKTGDFRIHAGSPPLLRIIMGLPLLFLDLKLPTDHPSWQSTNSTEFNHQFLYVYNKTAERIVFLSRLPMIILSVILGVLIFMWSKALYGYQAGLLSLFLYVFSPTILANAGLAMLDMGCALFIFLAIFQFFRYLKDKNLSNLILSGICFGLAQSTKHTSIILYPLFTVFILADIIANKKNRTSAAKITAHIISIWLIGLLVLWATYFFEFKPLLQGVPRVEEKINYIKSFAAKIPFGSHERLSAFLIHFAKDVPIPLSTYIVSLLGVVKILGTGQELVFMGQKILSGSKIYYLVDYIIKTPLAGLIIIILSGVLIRKRTRVGLLANLFLLLPVFVIFISAVFSHLQGGLRYILPMYPFLFVWLGDIVNVDLGNKWKRKAKVTLILLCLWYSLSSISVHPDYLAYFNELVGGPDGFGYKITDDIDWGQDLKALKKYLDRNKIPEIRLHYFGSAEPAYYGIRYRWFTDEEFVKPVPGAYYAVSSRALHGTKWANDYKPIARVAHTIFIYYIEKEQR